MREQCLKVRRPRLLRASCWSSRRELLLRHRHPAPLKWVNWAIEAVLSGASSSRWHDIPLADEFPGSRRPPSRI
eukprot:6029948-Prymnesium_polylepis.1